MRLLIIAPCVLFAASLRAQAPPAYADVAPIFAERCVLCHAGESAPLGLRLDSLEGVLEGSLRGPVVKAGAANESELVRRVTGSSQPRMPMTGPPFLDEAEIALIERWVDGGLAAAPAATAAAASTPGTAVARPGPGQPVTWLHVAPILAQRCAKCHTEQGLMGPAPEGFRLTSYEATLAADERVRVVPGQTGASELLRRVRGQALPRMPFDGPPWLDAEEIALLEEWIRQGARDATGRPAALPVGAELRLHGNLESGGRLDGLELIIGAGSRIDRNPAPGDYVEVRGRLDAEGRVVVERLRAR
ncbi:MAG: c-type cytochrome domain-containing protein [Lysobacterales bacterium]